VEAAAVRRRPAARIVLAAGALAAAAAVAIPVGIYELTRSGAGSSATVPLVSAAGLAERSGVRVVRVAMSGDGGLVDLRFQVVDADKAVAVHAPSTPPLLIDEKTGAVVSELLMGHTHTGQPKLGLTYYLIFVNPGVILRPGSRVTVQLGDARLAHVPVL
jgi:hypothetical protein